MSTASSTCSVPALPKTSLERYFKGFLDSSFSSLKGGGKNGKRPSTPFQSLEQDDFSTSIATTEPNDVTKDVDIKDKSSTTAPMSASMKQQQQNKHEKLNSSFSASSNNNNQCYFDRNIELVAVIDQQQQSQSSKSSSFSTNANETDVSFGNNDDNNIENKQVVGGIGALILANEGDPYVCCGDDESCKNRQRKDSWTSSSDDDSNNIFEIDDDDELVEAYQDEDSLKEFYQLNILPADVLPQVQSPLSPRNGKNKKEEEENKKEEQNRHRHYEIPQSISITISNDDDDESPNYEDDDEDDEDNTQGCALSVQECQDEYSFEKFYQLAIPDEIKKQQRLRPLVSPPSTPSSSSRRKNRKYQKVKKGNKKSTTTSTTNTTDNNGFVSPRDVVTYCDTTTASTNGRNTAADYDSTIMELVGWLTPQSGPSNQKRKVYIDQFVAAKTSNTSSTTNDDCPTSPLGLEEDDDEEDHGLDDDDNDHDCNDSQLSEDDSYGRRGQRTTKIFDIDLQLPSSLALPF